MTNKFELSCRKISFYLFLSALVPLAAASTFILIKYQQLTQLRNRIEEVEILCNSTVLKRATRRLFLEKHRSSDPQYIYKHLEHLTFLDQELRELNRIEKHPAFHDATYLSDRLAFLKSSNNKLNFSEGEIISSPLVLETEERQIQPIQVDIDDIQKILSSIEGVRIGSYSPPEGRPQLILKRFSINKVAPYKHHDVFELDMELIKREFPIK